MQKKLFFICMLLVTLATQAHKLTEVVYVDEVPKNIKVILGSDFGGTTVDFGLFQVVGGTPKLLFSLHVLTHEVGEFTQLVGEVLEHAQTKYGITVTHACFGAPGPASENRDYTKPEAIPTPVDAKDIIAQTNIEYALVVSDFEVIGYGLDLIDSKDLITVNKGNSRKHANKAVLGAGTGLGTSFMVYDWHKGRYISTPSEGGYSDFSPRNALEWDLVDFLKKVTGAPTIAWGDVLCGKETRGIVKTYEFLGTTGKYDETVAFKDPCAANIFNNYTRYRQCKDSVDMFLTFYARQAKNVAFYSLPYGGIYIVGGMAVKNAALFERSEFIQEFLSCTNAYNFKQLLEQFPVYVVKDYNVSLYGAAQYLLYEDIAL